MTSSADLRSGRSQLAGGIKMPCQLRLLQGEHSALGSENCHRFSKMPHTNRAELTRLFANFCHLWTKGLHANVQMKTTGSGGVVAQFEFELEKPNEIFPTAQCAVRKVRCHCIFYGPGISYSGIFCVPCISSGYSDIFWQWIQRHILGEITILEFENH